MSGENYRLVTLDELMVDPQPCDAVARTHESAVRDAYPFPVGHDNYLREARDWSELGGMVVGGEL